MREDGTIRSFPDEESAIAAGFRTALSEHEAKRLKRLPKAKRHAALTAMRADPNWRPTPHARRARSRGALRRAPQSVRRAVREERQRAKKGSR